MLARGARVGLGGQWVVERLIGRGAFGDVFCATHAVSGAASAVKAEAVASRRLLREDQAYGMIHSASGGAAAGFPRVHWCGEGEGVGGARLRLLVLQRLGPSLEEARRAFGGALPVRLLARLGRDMLRRLEWVHAQGLVHCDVKPGNVLLPAGCTSRGGGGAPAHFIDFGLARWAAPVGGGVDGGVGGGVGGGASEGGPGELLWPPPCRRGIVGSARFSSLPNHALAPLGPRDDVEALGYTLAFLGTGFPRASHMEVLTVT